jgi:hypothetical protein
MPTMDRSDSPLGPPLLSRPAQMEVCYDGEQLDVDSPPQTKLSNREAIKETGHN